MLTAHSLPGFDRLQYSGEGRGEIRRTERLLLPMAARVCGLWHTVPIAWDVCTMGTGDRHSSACDYSAAGPAVRGVASGYGSLCRFRTHLFYLQADRSLMRHSGSAPSASPTEREMLAGMQGCSLPLCAAAPTPSHRAQGWGKPRVSKGRRRISPWASWSSWAGPHG